MLQRNIKENRQHAKSIVASAVEGPQPYKIGRCRHNTQKYRTVTEGGDPGRRGDTEEQNAREV